MTETVKIVLTGRIASKKNQRINTRSGRSFPSKRYIEWHKEATYQLLETQNSHVRGFNIEKVKCIHYKLWSPDRRKYDLDNRVSSLQDWLVDNNIIPDDNYEVIPKFIVEYMGIKKGGYTEISLYTD